MKEGCSAARGTYTTQLQPGGSYPFTFYGHPAPLDDTLFNQYLDTKGLTATQPVGSGYAVSSKCYSPAGGKTDFEVQEKCCFKDPYDPVLPPYQNQYTVHSHAQDIYKEFCPQLPTGEEIASETSVGCESVAPVLSETVHVPVANGANIALLEPRPEVPQALPREECEKKGFDKSTFLVGALLLAGLLLTR